MNRFPLGIMRHGNVATRRLAGASVHKGLAGEVAKGFWFSSGTANDEVEVVQTKRSRRRVQRIDEVPSYKDFLHRQEVLGLFRKFLKTVRPVSDRKELCAQIKREFKAMKYESDPWNRKRSVKEGQRRLKDLQVTVSTSVTFSSPTKPDLPPEPDQEGPKVGTGWPWERKN
jgi:Complex 1 protein (LYR family)